MKPSHILKPIWRLQWADDDTLKSWFDKGVPFMAGERLTTMVQEAQARGYEQGEQQGRVNLRQAIESGEVEPIHPLKPQA